MILRLSLTGSRSDNQYFDEYAKVTNIFHSKELSLVYKYEIPGTLLSFPFKKVSTLKKY